MSAQNALQTAVGGIGDFYDWVADRLNDDAARAEVLIDLGLPPTITVGQPLPQHQIKGINDYRKTINIEAEVATAAAHDLGKALGLSSSKSAKLALPEKNLTAIRTYQKAADPSFDDFKKVLGDIKAIFSALANFVAALDVEGIHDKGELTHRLIDLLLVDYLRLHYPLVYWWAQAIGFLEEPVASVDLPKLVWGRLISVRELVSRHLGHGQRSPGPCVFRPVFPANRLDTRYSVLLLQNEINPAGGRRRPVECLDRADLRLGPRARFKHAPCRRSI